MHRRDFLKLGGLISSVMALPLRQAVLLPVEAQIRQTLYQGTVSGEFYVSQNAGRTWQLHSRLGKDFNILNISVDHAERIRAKVGFAGHSFNLVLAPNGRDWRTE